MTSPAADRLLTVPRWDRIPFLLHGFGLADWTARDLASVGPGFTVVPTQQVHSDRIHFVDRPDEAAPVGDALATDLSGVFLVIRTADCLPILLADEKRRVVAALHCGWRGTALRLAEKAAAALRARYGTEPSDLLAAFGPCIRKSCYEVGEDVRRRFEDEGLKLDGLTPHPSRPDKYLLDLQAANRSQLLRAGLDPGNMNFLGECPHCRPDMSSYRREGKAAGRMLAFVGLRAVSSHQS